MVKPGKLCLVKATRDRQDDMDVSRERQHERQELFERLEAVDDVKPFYNDEQAAALACTETHLVGHCEDGFVSCHGLDRTETFHEIDTQGCADCIVEVEPEALRVAIAAVDGEPCCFFSSICEAVEPVRESGCLAIACRSVEEREALASRAVEQVHNTLSWLAPETRAGGMDLATMGCCLLWDNLQCSPLPLLVWKLLCAGQTTCRPVALCQCSADRPICGYQTCCSSSAALAENHITNTCSASLVFKFS